MTIIPREDVYVAVRERVMSRVSEHRSESRASTIDLGKFGRLDTILHLTVVVDPRSSNPN